VRQPGETLKRSSSPSPKGARVPVRSARGRGACPRSPSENRSSPSEREACGIVGAERDWAELDSERGGIAGAAFPGEEMGARDREEALNHPWSTSADEHGRDGSRNATCSQAFGRASSRHAASRAEGWAGLRTTKAAPAFQTVEQRAGEPAPRCAEDRDDVAPRRPPSERNLPRAAPLRSSSSE